MDDQVRRSRACNELAELRSAFVDGALDDTDRERLLAHLIDCPACRADVVETRRLRRLLGEDTSPDTAPPSYDLADRLVAIAGTDAREPLLAAPFRTTGGSTRRRPLRRRRRGTTRVMTTAATIGAGAVLVVAVGLSAAPPLAATIADPTAGARSEFSTLAAQEPLADSVGSAAMSTGRTLNAAFVTSPSSIPPPTDNVSVARELDAIQALAVLRRAAGAAGQVSYHGNQAFQMLSGGRLVGTQFTVETRMGAGREIAVLDATGQVLTTVSADAISRVVDSDQLDLLVENYLLVGSRGVEVAGRAATVVSAIGPSGLTAARWWTDDESGLLLWHETYDSSGRTVLSAGFTSVRIGASDAVAERSKRPSVPVTSTSLTLSSTSRLETAGWVCPDELSGLTLVRLRTDSAADPAVVHLGYTDGLSSVSVFEQHGTLAQAPAGAAWDDDMSAYVAGGAAKVASWQSGSMVFTVVTDGSPELLAAAVEALPHQPTPPRTTVDRVHAGWSRILDSLTG